MGRWWVERVQERGGGVRGEVGGGGLGREWERERGRVGEWLGGKGEGAMREGRQESVRGVWAGGGGVQRRKEGGGGSGLEGRGGHEGQGWQKGGEEGGI